jgi:serine/threonine-protein kinase
MACPYGCFISSVAIIDRLNMTALLEISPGTFIGDRYRIETLLGQGGFGRTYLVSDQQCLGALCVLKEFFPITQQENTFRKALELFQREAKVLQKLDHPQIPQFLNWFEDRERVCIIQEYIDGKTYWELLNQRLERGRVFCEAEVVRLLKDLLPVLDYLHSCHVIHRDISPDNIMFSRQRGKPILIDLGIVREAVTQGYYSQISHNATLGAVSLVGKRGYSPPEQILMGQCYPSSDLYSLAVTALVLLTGRSPTNLFDSHAMEWQWQNYVEVSDTLRQIFSRMLVEKPKERYQSAKEVIADLSALAPKSYSTPIIMSSFVRLSTLFVSGATQKQDLNSPPQDKIFCEDKTPSKSGKLIKAGGIMAASMLLSSMAIGFGSPFIPGLCKKLDNCATDARYHRVYQEQVEQGQEAISQASRAQSVKELQKARDRLNQTLTQLKTIPNDAKVSPRVQQILKDYRTRFEQLNIRVVRGQQAEQELQQAEVPIAQATKTTEAAKTVAQYRQAKAQWDKVREYLKAIPSDTVVARQIKTQLAQSNAKITEIQTKIEQQVREAQQQAQPQARKKSSRSLTLTRKAKTNSINRQTSSSGRAKPSRISKSNRPTSRRVRTSVRRSPSRSSLWGASPRRSSSSRSRSPLSKKPLW